MLIDTHAHLWWDLYKDDVEAVIERAKEAGVEKIVVPGTNIESSVLAIELAKKYPGIIYAAIGVHPEELSNTNSNEETPFACRRALLDLQSGIPFRESPRTIVAIGEIGIDLYTEKEKATLEAQKKLFREQCELAIELDLPVIIHTRDSFEEVWEVLSSLPTMPRGQFHCFSVDEISLKKAVEAGFYVSFCGNIMYSKRVAKLVALVPDDKLLLETDSPFMQPGERNEPAYTRVLAEKVAELRGKEVGEIEEMTTANVKRLYHL